MEQSIFDTLLYFSRFGYPPTIAELHRYLAVPTTEMEVQQEVNKLNAAGSVRVEQGRILLADRNYAGYFVREQDTKDIMQYSRSYLTNLEFIPTIELIGISGSASMANASSIDDIDLFIITKQNTIWITRFLVLLYKKILSLINPKISEKLCFNLFFAENGLQLSKEKQNTYVAHEILQLKVFYNKSGVYHEFLSENAWVESIFPNAKMRFETPIRDKVENGKIMVTIDRLLGLIQKWWLRRKRFNYRETQGQLWLIQKDWSLEANS